MNRRIYMLQVCLRNAPGRKAAGEAPASTACAAEPLAARGTPEAAVEPAQGSMSLKTSAKGVTAQGFSIVWGSA